MPKADASGVGIEYDDRGSGEPALLFLTGWCSSKERWEKVADIAGTRRRVLGFDWRGHGASDAAPGDFGVEEMVEDALAVIDASGVETFVPCAASHSGWVAIELRRRLGERVPALFHADWMLAVPSTRYMEVIGQLDSEEWPEARDTLFAIWGAGVDTPEIRRVLGVMAEHGEEMWRRSGREIGASYARGGSPLQAYSALEPSMPVLHAYGQPQDPDYLELQRRFAGDTDWFSVLKLDAATHFAMIEAAPEVADAIEGLVSQR
ncbi:MAG: alpha/beta hydrolase [Gaiellaceae bacterium]